MADVIVERNSDEPRRSGSNMGVIVGVIAIVLLVLLALFLLPSLTGNNTTTNPIPETTVPSATTTQ